MSICHYLSVGLPGKLFRSHVPGMRCGRRPTAALTISKWASQEVGRTWHPPVASSNVAMPLVGNVQISFELFICWIEVSLSRFLLSKEMGRRLRLHEALHKTEDIMLQRSPKAFCASLVMQRIYEHLWTLCIGNIILKYHLQSINIDLLTK